MTDPSARKLSTWIPVSDEWLIDAGLASPEVIARDKARRAAVEARWRALPWYVRFARRQVWPRRDEAQGRIAHAWRALRGVECERE